LIKNVPKIPGGETDRATKGKARKLKDSVQHRRKPNKAKERQGKYLKKSAHGGAKTPQNKNINYPFETLMTPGKTLHDIPEVYRAQNLIWAKRGCPLKVDTERAPTFQVTRRMVATGEGDVLHLLRKKWGARSKEKNTGGG